MHVSTKSCSKAKAAETGEAAAPDRVAPRRPGLPFSLVGQERRRSGYDASAMRDAAVAAEAARETRAGRIDNAERSDQASSDGGVAADQVSDQQGAEGQDVEGSEPGTSEAETASEPSALDGSETSEGGGQAAAAPAAAPSARQAFPIVNPPPLPMVPLPDLNAIRAPLVPPPPPRAIRRRDKILQSSGRTPEDHHATVQTGVNRVAEVARSAQRDVVAEVGRLASGTRHGIEQLADIVPRVVAGGIARIRAETSRVRVEIEKIAKQQMNVVANHEDVAQGDLETSRAATSIQMQEKLLAGAHEDLATAKEKLDEALDATVNEAGRRIRRIPRGEEPQSVSDGVPLNANDRATADKALAARQAELAKYEHKTFVEAGAPIDVKLMQDRRNNRLAQYGNLQCSAALSDLIADHQESYDDANQVTVDNLNSPENKARFFAQSMQLTLPISKAYQNDEEGFREHLDSNVEDKGMALNDAQIRTLQQMDGKLSTVLEERLNEDFKDSLPHQAIDGLQKAGKQIEQGLRDQAKSVEASLKSNLANLAAAYPDLVDRLGPMVQSGEFLEATAMLSRLAEAEASVGSLKEGHIASVAGQAEQALDQARVGFEKQIAGLHKSTRSSLRALGRFEHQAKWDFFSAATDYTGLIDDGMNASLEMLRAHATELASRLLGPKTKTGQTFDNFKTAAIRYLNGVMAGEWEGYLQRVNDLEKDLGGVQEAAEGTEDSTGQEDNDGKPFRLIRDGVRTDTLVRANQIVNALPARPPLAARVVGYVVFPGPIYTGIVDYMTNPDEDDVISALSIPWPGPWAIHERHQLKDQAAIDAGREMIGLTAQIAGTVANAPGALFGGESTTLTIYNLIDQRLDDPEHDPALDLFSASVANRSEAKQALLNASGIFGISDEAAMALAQSLTADEVSGELMTRAKRDELAVNLRSSLSPPEQEIAAAYINNEPDRALALRLRNHFNTTRNHRFNEQMDAGNEMEALIQRELFMSGSRGYVPPARLERMREAAIIRLGGLVEAGQGETPRFDAQVGVTIDRTGPAASGRVPLTAGQIPEPAPTDTGEDVAAEPAKFSTRSPTSEPTPEAPDARDIPSQAETEREQERERQLEQREEALRPPTAEEADSRAATLRDAQAAVIQHLNRPRETHRGRNNRYLVDAVERRPEIGVGVQARQRRYDPETGNYQVDPAQAVQNYNRALITNGPSAPETRAAQAVAELRRVERGSGDLSITDTNSLHQRFTDREFASMRVRWREASPRERRGLRRQWEKAQSDHAMFLRLTAEGLGLDQGLDEPDRVEAFLGDRLGLQFAREGSDFREVGTQIISQGRVDIDLGLELASGDYGHGTNDALLQSVIAGRWQSELAEESRRHPGRSMGDFAQRIVDREVDGDAGHEAEISLMGIPENDLDRAAIAKRRFEHQRAEGSGYFSTLTMADQSETRWLESSRDNVDDRILEATRAGMAEARKRGIDLTDLEMPTNLRLANGEWHPAVSRFAMDGNGQLRGNGPLMSSLASDVEQSAGFYREEIDRQEAFLLSAVAVLAVVLMFIPVGGMIASAILTALVTGVATIVVKAGMRGLGGRYGFEEMATDMASTAIEVATVGVGGKLAGAAKLANAGRAGRITRNVAAMQARLGKGLTPVANEAITGAIGGAANAALDDSLWDDGLGTGIARVTGRGLQGAVSSAANAGISGMLTNGVQRGLRPNAPRGKGLGRLNRAGRALGPQGREMVEEIVSNVGGALSSETVNLLAELLVYLEKGQSWEEFKKASGGYKGLAMRFGQTAVKEGVSASGRTVARRAHRARHRRMAAELHEQGRDPTPVEAIILNRIAQSAGLVEEGTKTATYVGDFSRTRARMADMPTALRRHLVGMDPNSAAQIISMMDSGNLGKRADRLAIVNDLALKIPGLDAASFDTILLRANQDHKSARQARRGALKIARDQLLDGIKGPERAALQPFDASDLIGLPKADMQRLARMVGNADADPALLKALVHELLPGDPGRAARVGRTLEQVVKATADARLHARRQQARNRDDLMLAAPAELRETIGQMKPRDLAALKRLINDGDLTSTEEAYGLIMRADPGLEPLATRALVDRIRDSAALESGRHAHLDHVPPEHRSIMLQLPDDALLELRLAQYQRRPLAPERIKAILGTVKAARPGADLALLKRAIDETLTHPHGRPGFREALAQKRALLDKIPWGMRRRILRTPILTLPDSAFLSYVRGKGNEQAVTLTLNGETVILIRQGADREVLGEEGMHVLQLEDPAWRTRALGLGEERMARWDEMTIDQQVAAYRSKMAIEIDAQQRMIARLDRRAAFSRWPPVRARARKQLASAEETLSRLRPRLKRAEALGADDMMRIAADPSLRPSWLDQPARMFAKSDSETLFQRLVPEIEGEVASEFERLAKPMRHSDRIKLGNTLRLLHGAVPRDDLLHVLKVIRRDEVTDPEFGHLARMRPSRVADKLADEFLHLSPGRQRHVDTLANDTRGFFNNLSGAERHGALIENVINALSANDGNRTSHLAITKRALLVRLSNLPPGGAPAGRLKILEHAAMILGIAPHANDLLALHGKPDLQSAALEGLTITKTLHRDDASKRITAVAEHTYVDTVRQLVEGDLAQMGRDVQRAALRHVSASYFGGASPTYLQHFTSLIEVVAKHNAGRIAPGDRLNLHTIIHTLNDYPQETRTRMAMALTGLAGLVLGQSLSAKPGGPTVTGALLTRYLKSALKDPVMRRSLWLLGHRANARGALSSNDIDALLEISAVKEDRKRDPFNVRFGAPLDGDDPVHGTKERAAAILQGTASSDHGFNLSIEEARAIAQRTDVLEHVSLFSAVTGHARTRGEYLGEFFSRVRDEGIHKILDADKRGDAIDKAFRMFVRHMASDNIDVIRAIGSTDMSDEARRAMIDILLRGDIRGQINKKGEPILQDLSDEVRIEVDQAKQAMIDRYREAHQPAEANGARRPEVPLMSEADLRALLDRGIFNVETTAKGSMMEVMLNRLLWGVHEDVFPATLRSVFALLVAQHVKDGEAFRAQREPFKAIDQLKKNSNVKGRERSFDHVFEVADIIEGLIDRRGAGLSGPMTHEQAPLHDLGLSPGDRIAGDSKNGEGAFEPNQFKRYLVEMMKAIVEREAADAGQPRRTSIPGEETNALRDPSVFGGEDGLNALMYISNNAENMFGTRDKVESIMHEILGDGGIDAAIVIKIDKDSYDLTRDMGLTRDMLLRHREMMKVFFARLGQTGTAGDGQPGQIHLGPLALIDPGNPDKKGLPQLIQELLSSE